MRPSSILRLGTRQTVRLPRHGACATSCADHHCSFTHDHIALPSSTHTQQCTVALHPSTVFSLSSAVSIYSPHSSSTRFTSMMASPPGFGRTPSVDREKGAIAARRHITIQQLETLSSPPTAAAAATASPLSASSSSSSLSAASSVSAPQSSLASPSAAIIPIPFSADAREEELPVISPLPSEEARRQQEGGAFASAADDLQTFNQIVITNPETAPALPS